MEPATSYVTGRGRSRDGGDGPRNFRLPRQPAAQAGSPLATGAHVGLRLPDADAAILGAGRPSAKPGRREAGALLGDRVCARRGVGEAPRACGSAKLMRAGARVPMRRQGGCQDRNYSQPLILS